MFSHDHDWVYKYKEERYYVGGLMAYIEIKDYCKVIKNQTVLKHINLDLEKGKIYGLYGRNGSGKTMLLRAIAGLIHASSGEIIIEGKKLHKDIDFPLNTGIIIETLSLLPQYSAYKNLYLLSKIQRVACKEDIENAIKLVGLDPHNHKKIKTYSMGMKQKLNIAQAIFENQELLLLDEPTNALDEESVKNIFQLFVQLKKENKTIIIASHDKEDLIDYCDEIFEVKNGEIHSWKKVLEQ